MNVYCICQWLFGYEDSDVAVKFIVYVVLLEQERSFLCLLMCFLCFILCSKQCSHATDYHYLIWVIGLHRALILLARCDDFEGFLSNEMLFFLVLNGDFFFFFLELYGFGFSKW